MKRKRLRMIAFLLTLFLTLPTCLTTVKAATYSEQIAAAEKELTAAQTKLTELQKKEASAKSAYEKAKPSATEDSLIGFLSNTTYGMGWTNALSYFNSIDKVSRDDPSGNKYTSYTTIGASSDATSLDGLMRSIELLEEGNQIRNSEGRTDLKVSAEAMLVAALECNYYDKSGTSYHSSCAGMVNNLAKCYEDPYDGWYTSEKKKYEEGDRVNVGHYLTLISAYYPYAGFATIVGDYKGTYSPALNRFCMTFDDSTKNTVIMDVATVKKKAQSYINYIDSFSATEKAAYEKSQAAVTAQEKVVSEKEAALTALKPTGVSLSTSTLSLTVGSSSTLTATVKPSTAYSGVTWTTSNSSVATVSNGTVKAVKAGTATITAKTANGKTATCTVSVTATPSTKAVYRLFNRATGEHLYTTDANEYATLYKKHGWGQEGIGWYAPSSGTAVYRLYQPGLDNHLYTTDLNEVKVLTSKYGWKKDNNGKAVFYSGGSIPIYRVYNAKVNGLHHLTTGQSEYEILAMLGWKQEGVKLYASKVGNTSSTTIYF